jgi:hypothetical protein
MLTKYSILLLLFLLSAFPFASGSAQRGDDKKGTAAVNNSQAHRGKIVATAYWWAATAAAS